MVALECLNFVCVVSQAKLKKDIIELTEREIRHLLRWPEVPVDSYFRWSEGVAGIMLSLKNIIIKQEVAAIYSCSSNREMQ